MKQTALIIVDMVKDFTQPDGLVFYPQNREILPRIKAVLEECRKHEVLIVFLKHCNRKGKSDRRIEKMRPNCIEGSTGVEIDDMLLVKEEDYVIPKRRYSGFFGTDLDLVLRENGIKTVVIVGTKTNCCIRATVTDAFYYDYDGIVLRDCVATNSAAAQSVHLEDIHKYLGTVMTSQQFVKKLEQKEL